MEFENFSLMCKIQIVGGNRCNALGKKSSLLRTIWVLLVIPKAFAIIVFFSRIKNCVKESRQERKKQTW